MRTICEHTEPRSFSETIAGKSCPGYDFFPTVWENEDGTLSFDLETLRREMEERGIPYDEDAVANNWDAWRQDFKSGYVSEKTGMFYFTPCGHNAFRVTVEKHIGADYQTTYEC